jgi:hypothetical protein
VPVTLGGERRSYIIRLAYGLCDIPLSFLYREQPDDNIDSGWCFLSGAESQEYADDPDNWAIYDLNTIANYDRSIISYLDAEPGAKFERVPGTDRFRSVS